MLIQETLDAAFADRTKLVVAHRLSTIINADMILVVQDGKIIERGKHKDLLAFGGEYYSIWNRQKSERSEQNGAHQTVKPAVAIPRQ
jgi:ABC-type transport system involved in Fe-S cluster assembly fused permease/ATPase subunit